MDRTLANMRDQGSTSGVRPPATNDGVDQSPIVLPSPDVWAVVRFAPPPDTAPSDLQAFAIRCDDQWVLTDDALAFGEIETVQRFHEWRATWEQVRTLEPLTTLLRLVDLAGELAPASDGSTGLLHPSLAAFLVDDDVFEIPARRSARSADAIARLADLVRDRGAEGFGIVDRSPRSERVGLARAWPAYGGVETVAASADLRVVFDPAAGLFCELPDDAGTSFGPIERAESTSAVFTLWSGDAELRLTSEQSRPLHWMIPGATAWAVRRVPEILAWARTFAGLADSFELAQRIDAPVRLSARRPIADYGSSNT